MSKSWSKTWNDLTSANLFFVQRSSVQPTRAFLSRFQMWIFHFALHATLAFSIGFGNRDGLQETIGPADHCSASGPGCAAARPGPPGRGHLNQRHWRQEFDLKLPVTARAAAPPCQPLSISKPRSYYVKLFFPLYIIHIMSLLFHIMSLLFQLFFSEFLANYVILCQIFENSYYFNYFNTVISIMFFRINYFYYINYVTIISLIFNQVYYVTFFFWHELYQFFFPHPLFLLYQLCHYFFYF